ncbi:MAG TPA: nucleotidyltransferase family protein [Acidimicrobiia bacterium]|nr:nucleotidyltransferase family protein [Acidimicrobiia bacterium]
MARPHPALIELAADRVLPPVDDLPGFLRSAMEHRMLGLVWRHVQSGGLAMDPELQRGLATESLLTEQRHRHLSAALLHASELLAGKGIDVATFKGVAAERRWYDGVGDRPCWDADLLVAPHSLSRAGQLIEVIDPHRPNDGRIQRLVDAGILQTVDVVFEGVVLDIHFDLFKLGFRSRQPDVVWDRTVQVTLADGSSVRALDAETSLVFSLLHLNKDRFAKLLGFAEVLRIMKRGDIDWEFVETFVSREGLETSHSHALYVVLETLGIEHMRRNPSTGWRSRLWNALFPRETRLLGEAGRLRYGRRTALLFPFLVRGRSWDAARYLVRRMFPKSDMVDLVHPGTSGPYLWRLTAARVRQRMKRAKERRVLDAREGH